MFARQVPLVGLLFVAAVDWTSAGEIAKESFDGGGHGYTTSVAEFDEPTISAVGDYFSVQPNDGSKLSSSITIPSGDGAFMFAGEDLNSNPPGFASQQSLTINPVDISGLFNTSVKILLAAPGSALSINQYDWNATPSLLDFVRVEASIDGGPFNRLIQFSPTNAILNQALSEDTDGNGVGGQGTVLNAGFQEFTLPIATGATVQVRVVMQSTDNNEYLCVDNIRVFGDTVANNPPVLAGVPGTALAYEEGDAPTALAPAITVTDGDSPNLASATVVIAQNLASGEDVLSATPNGAILAGDIVYTPATGTLSITGSASLATYQTVLRSVTYQNTNTTAPSIATRQVRFTVSDGTISGNEPTRDVTVTDNIDVLTLPVSESFETDGRGTRYALDGRFSAGGGSFDRGTPAGVTNVDGNFAVIGDNTALDLATKAARFHINTDGFTNLTATVRLGVPNAAVFDAGDLVAIETSVDGGSYSQVAIFRSKSFSGNTMALDTDNNGTGDGAELGTAMQDFTFNLPAAGTLGLRIRVNCNDAGEIIVLDRVLVQCAPASVVTNTEDSGPGSLRQALVNATAVVGAATVTFDPLLDGQTISVSNELVVNSGAGVTVDASPLTSGLTLDDGGGNNHRLLRIDSGSSLTLRGLTLADGGGSAFTGDGGAILNFGTLVVERCLFTGNTARRGGAICISGGSANIIHSTLTGNIASVEGSGVHAAGSTILRHCTIAGNTAGPAQTRYLTANLDGAQEVPPVATSGTGTCFMELNTATGAWALSGGYSGLTGTANNAHIHGPAAEGVSAGVVKGLTHSGGSSGTLTGSSAVTSIYSSGQITDALGSLHYVNVHSTFAGGGEIRGQLIPTVPTGISIASATTLTLENSIVSGNTNGDIANQGTLNRLGANLVFSFISGGGALSGGGTISTVDPLLCPLENYGGPTKTMALASGSPARDASSGSGAISDQREFPIVGTADVGAYETGTLDPNYLAFIFESLPAGSPTGFYAATYDYDGDGASNEDEWIMGSNVAVPVVGTQAGAISAAAISMTHAQILVAIVNRRSNRTYILLESVDLSSGSWSPVTGQNPFYGTQGSGIWEFPKPTNGDARFYRVGITKD